MPSFPVIEVVFAPASDAQRNSPHDVEIGNTTFSILRKQEGLVKCVSNPPYAPCVP